MLLQMVMLNLGSSALVYSDVGSIRETHVTG